MTDDGRITPPDSLTAMQAAILRTEAHAERAADFALMAYEEARRVRAVEDRVSAIELRGYGHPLAVALLALAISLASLLLVGCVITGRV